MKSPIPLPPLGLAVVLLLTSLLASAQVKVDWLTGASEKAWQVEAFDIKLGSAANCTKGIQYTFKVNGQLTIRSCIDSHVQVESHTFETEHDGIDAFISFGGERYRLVHSKRTNDLGLEEEELVVRKDGSKQKPTVDLIMVHIP